MIWIILVLYFLIGIIIGTHENYKNQPHDDEGVYLLLWPLIWPVLVIYVAMTNFSAQTNKFWRWVYTRKEQSFYLDENKE